MTDLRGLAVVFGATLALAGAAVIAEVAWRAALGHEWYPVYCCHDKDCRPVGDDDVVLTPRGWLVRSSGDVIPFNRAQVSPDGKFHVCSYGGHPETRTICLFTPGMGS